MNQIIDKPLELMKKSEDELDEILLDSKYNLPNLRELIRRTLRMLKEQVDYSNYLQKQNEQLRNLILNANSWNEEICRMQKKLRDI